MASLQSFGAAALAIGGLLVLIAILLVVRKLKLARQGSRAVGTILRCDREHSDIGTGWLYTPTVQFQTADGRTIEHTPRIATNHANYAVGSTVTVVYDPQQPDRVMIGTPGGLRFWMPAVICVLVGLVFCLVGGVLMVISGSKLF